MQIAAGILAIPLALANCNFRREPTISIALDRRGLVAFSGLLQARRGVAGSRLIMGHTNIVKKFRKMSPEERRAYTDELCMILDAVIKESERILASLASSSNKSPYPKQPRHHQRPPDDHSLN